MYSADKLKRHRSHHARQKSSQNLPAMSRMVNGDLDRSENQPLLGRTEGSSGQPLWEHDNPVVRYPMLTAHKTMQVLASNYVNILLVFVPAGIVTGAIGANPTAVFVLNFLAIIPLASLLSFATEELAAKLGQTLGGLLNATFGNAVELIVGGVERTIEIKVLISLANR